jgi:hypothetical protein
MITEMLVTAAVLTTLLGAYISLDYAMRRHNDVQQARCQCIAAAQGQLDHLAATGSPLPEAAAERFWPGVKVTLSRTDGTGDWAGLMLVTASATRTSHGQAVTMEMRRYLPQGAQP